mmetsp:Transcript_14548/g.31342  ORF Transcript_14548/g.31342 Transcript_14548/m.31342 type:complete len:906 (-) Transcript_14548:70-2787(-)
MAEHHLWADGDGDGSLIKDPVSTIKGGDVENLTDTGVNDGTTRTFHVAADAGERSISKRAVKFGSVIVFLSAVAIVVGVYLRHASNADGTNSKENNGNLFASSTLQSQEVKMVAPSITNGYSTCFDLQKDIVDALKHYAKSLIQEEATSSYSEMYASCDPNNPNWQPEYQEEVGDGGGYMYDEDTTQDAQASPLPDPNPVTDNVEKEVVGKISSKSRKKHKETKGSSKQAKAASSSRDVNHSRKKQRSSSGRANSTPFNSFQSKNQVEGMDTADKVKSDGTHVFTAYQDVIYAWNASDALQGVSITKIPDNSYDCDFNKGAASPCTYISKPTVKALLLSGTRLTAIVGQYIAVSLDPTLSVVEGTYAPPIISNEEQTLVYVFDTSILSLDGTSPLNELGHGLIVGSYVDGALRTVDDTALIASTNYIYMDQFTEALYRFQPPYCGLNSTQYIELAAETASKSVDSFAEKMVSELSLVSGCSNIFRLSMMQSSAEDVPPDLNGRNLLNQFIQVTTFDSSSDFGEEGIIPMAMSGAFAQGSYNFAHFMMAEDFVAAASEGYIYDYSTEKSYTNTYILGFDITGAVAEPFTVGSVQGELNGKYSMDKWNGHLRLLTHNTVWDVDSNFTTTRNKIFVLRIPGQEVGSSVMQIVGESGTLLDRDDVLVYFTLFIEDKAYVSAAAGDSNLFIAMDLSDHTNPQVVGEISSALSGSMSNLQKVIIDDAPFILGIGMGHKISDEDIHEPGMKLLLFDISDPSSPKISADYLDIGIFSTQAEYDSQASRFLTESMKFIVAVYSSSDGNFTEKFVVIDVESDSLEPVFNITTTSVKAVDYCWYEASVPPRILAIQSKLTAVNGNKVVNADLDTGHVEWELDLDVGLNYSSSSCDTFDEYYYYNDDNVTGHNISLL